MGKYKSEYADQCYKLCLLGHKDRELGEFFGVDEKTIQNWAEKHPEFGDARRKGKEIADAEVAQALLKRAKGGHQVERVKVTKDGDVIRYKEEVDADVRACETWLSSRQGAKWNPKQQVEHSGQVDSNVSMAFLMDDINEQNEDSSPLPNEGS